MSNDPNRSGSYSDEHDFSNSSNQGNDKYERFSLPSFGKSMFDPSVGLVGGEDVNEFLEDSKEGSFLRGSSLFIGSSTLVGAGLGGVVGIAEAARWNPPSAEHANRFRINKLLNSCTRNGTKFATNFGAIATIFECTRRSVAMARDEEEDALTTIAAGAATGFIYRSFAGITTASKSAALGVILAAAFEALHQASQVFRPF